MPEEQLPQSGKKMLGPIVLGLVVVAGIAWLGISSYQDKQALSSVDTSLTTLETTPVADLKPVSDILLLATPDLGTATVASVETEVEEGQTLYKLVLSDGQVLFYNALTGQKVLPKQSASIEVDDELLKKAALTSDQALLTFADARRLAGEVRAIGIKKVDLENDGGVIIYKIEFIDEGKLELDARTGKVVYRKDPGLSEQKFGDDDFDNDTKTNDVDVDDDNDKVEDVKDTDDDGDKIEDSKDDDDDNDRIDDPEDKNNDEKDNSGSN
jgi:uncharacterized membrane protein YkoI